MSFIRRVDKNPALVLVLQKHQTVFDEQQPHSYTGPKARFEFKADAQPKFFRPRDVPYALAPKVEEELNRLQKTDKVGGPDRAGCQIRRVSANLRRLQADGEPGHKTQSLSPPTH